MVLEVFVPGFVLACLGLGSFGGAIAAYIDFSFEAQLVTAALTALVAFVFLASVCIENWIQWQRAPIGCGCTTRARMHRHRKFRRSIRPGPLQSRRRRLEGRAVEPRASRRCEDGPDCHRKSSRKQYPYRFIENCILMTATTVLATLFFLFATVIIVKGVRIVRQSESMVIETIGQIPYNPHGRHQRHHPHHRPAKGDCLAHHC